MQSWTACPSCGQLVFSLPVWTLVNCLQMALWYHSQIMCIREKVFDFYFFFPKKSCKWIHGGVHVEQKKCIFLKEVTSLKL